MCSNKNLLPNITPIHSHITVCLPDGSSKIITHTGQANLNQNLILTDVLYVPSFKYNLLSIAHLTQTCHLKCVFFPTYCLLQDLKSKRTLAVGRAMGKLYILDSTCFNTSSFSLLVFPADHRHIETTSFSFCNNTFDIWHKRFGHASPHLLQHLSFLKPLCTQSVQDSIQACDVCHQSKQYRLPFPISSIHTTAPFELVHMDIWGPYKSFCLTRTPYMLTLVDDFSRATWIFLLSHKNQVTQSLKNFFHMIGA